MKTISKNLSFFYCILFSLLQCSVIAQNNTPETVNDTIWTMNGEKIIAKVIDTAMADGVKVFSSRKNKNLILEPERVFSIKFSNGNEKVLYLQDTATDNYYSVEDERLYIFGEHEGNANYKSPMSAIGSLLIAASSAYFFPSPDVFGKLGVSLSPIPAFIYTGLILLPKIKIDKRGVSDINYLKNDAYVLGYERNARKIKTMNSLKGALVGLITGFVIYSAVH